MFDHVRAFYQPGSIPEAIRLLTKEKRHACVLAGGTDLVLRAGRSVTVLVDISRMGLSYIKPCGRGFRIGATTTMNQIVESPQMQNIADGILAKAAASCGAVQTRNVATIGGNLANASPAADSAVPLLALDAAIVLYGSGGRKRVPLAEFFTGPHKTIAQAALLTEVIIPASSLKPNMAYSFQRLARTETDIAIVNVAVGVQLDRHGMCTWARVALGAVAPQPIRSHHAEAALVGKPLIEGAIESAASAAADESQPITDIRASAEYRRDMTRVLVRRALHECAERLERAL